MARAGRVEGDPSLDLRIEWKELLRRTPVSSHDACLRDNGQARKGAWWMPRDWEAMKDVDSCDKLRGAANRH